MFAELIHPSFNDFWNAYDKKVGRNYCEKKWNRLKPEIKEQIIQHVIEYVKSTPNKQYRKNPETYLNNECWNDEIIPYNDKGNTTIGKSFDRTKVAEGIQKRFGTQQ